MREVVLRDFFLGLATPVELARDVRDSIKKVGPISFEVEIEDMEGEFLVTREMLVSLCDAVLLGQLPAQELSPIGFALASSESFAWNVEDVVHEVIHDWSCLEVNYPLTLDNIQRFRRWLLQLETHPARPQVTRQNEGERLISITEKRSVRRLKGK
jgi:hypothetical protein